MMRTATTTSSDVDDTSMLRVLVVGETNIGKTLLIRRLCHQIFARGPSNSEFMNQRWGPTVGFYVDALTRDTQLPAPVPNRPADYSVSPYTVSGRSSYGGPAPLERRQQRVELYEIGGTRHFQDGCLLPLQMISYDGILFLYDRCNPVSTSYLLGWYERLRKLLCGDTVRENAQGQSSVDKSSRRAGCVPKIMLVGTQLHASSPLPVIAATAACSLSSPTMCSSDGESLYRSSTACIPDEAFISGGHDLGRVRGSRWGRGGGVWGGRLHGAVMRLVAVLWFLANPSVIVSEQYQEERSGSHGAMGRLRCLVESLAHVALSVEHALLFVMSTALFGPQQHVVPLHVPTVRTALDIIRDDPNCIAQAHVCYLYDAHAFEGSLDEILRFFDVLHREKLFAERGATGSS